MSGNDQMPSAGNVSVLTLTVGFMGQSFTSTFAAPLNRRDPMEMTLAEWQVCPRLSADAMLAKVMEGHRR